MKEFNIRGTCFPEKHYMVDLTSRLEAMKKMIDDETYFCINRGRQYGKTTTINALCDYLKDDCSVFSITFEDVSANSFVSLEKLLANVLYKMNDVIQYDEVFYVSEQGKEILARLAEKEEVSPNEFKAAITKFIKNNEKPVVLIIDEVDQASNYDSFIKFLGILRAAYLIRNKRPAFQSVILASVYDIKNLKKKIPGSTGEPNSPWNIAASFDMPMEFDVQGIAGMLREYISERKLKFDVEYIAQQIEDYTGGYPFLVSKICQLMDSNQEWNKDGLLKAVKILLKEKNTLWDDMNKKLQQFPKMNNMFRDILYNGVNYSYSHDIDYVDIAESFGYIKEQDGKVCIANRLFETKLYDIYWMRADHEKIGIMKNQGERTQFIENGHLNIERVLEKFSQHYNDIYSEKDVKFLEAECRKMFMLYVKPIINGTGNYYIEAETRDGTRTDMVIDYLGEQFVIEMKIWRGEAYQRKGEQQLAEYLEKLHADKGYLVTFNFNKNKTAGRAEKVVAGKTIVEYVV